MHTYARPSWDCAGCGEPWPCAPARADLSEDYRPERIGLAVYLGMLLVEALADQHGQAPGDLYQRMLGWIHT